MSITGGEREFFYYGAGDLVFEGGFMLLTVASGVIPDGKNTVLGCSGRWPAPPGC